MVRRQLLLIIAIGETIKPFVILCCFLVVSLVRAGDETSCNVPSITKVNFENCIEILNGTNRTLFCEIRSDNPLKEEPTWRKDSSRLSTDIKYSVENASCSNSTSQTCTVSNLTLINAVRYKDSSPYAGNYSLTAENDCGIATVYVYVDIYIPSSCEEDYSKPPQLKIPPPSVIQAVEGHSVTITAQYEGDEDDNQLGVYWCVYKTQHDYYCYNISEDDNYDVSTDGCPPGNESCCYFTVLLKIKSVTRNLTLQSMVVWHEDPQSFIPGNSSLVANVYPTLDKQIPNANNKCVELNEGQSTEFTCIYNASTDPNITITTWKFNEELLEYNSSHYTMTTQYGSDPVNFNCVLSRIVLSNVAHDNAGTYTCQCVYNPKVIIDDKDVVSEAASICLKVNKPGFPWWWIMVGIVVLILVGLLIFWCYKKRKKKKSDDVNEHTRLLGNVADDIHPDNNQNEHKKRNSKSCRDIDRRLLYQYVTELAPHWYDLGVQLLKKNSSLRVIREDYPSDVKKCCNEMFDKWLDEDTEASWNKLIDALKTIEQFALAEKISSNVLKDDASSTDHTNNQDELISGQDPHLPTASLLPNHQRSDHQRGDMVTGANITVEVHDQLAAHSTSLESFKNPSGNGHVTSKQDVQHGSIKAADTEKPIIPILSTEGPIESEAERPGTQCPVAVQPPRNELVVPRLSNPAKNNVLSADSERATVEPSTGCHNRILDLIAPDFRTNVNIVTLLPYLQQHDLVTSDEEHHLCTEVHSDVKKAQLLLDYLKRKGDGSLQMILCCLNLADGHSGHKDIAVKLKQIMEANNIKCADFCAEHSKC